jgi:hypothetical protein
MFDATSGEEMDDGTDAAFSGLGTSGIIEEEDDDDDDDDDDAAAFVSDD